MIKQQFYGHPESPLFGVFHQPRGSGMRGKAQRAALICPPIGQEYNRTHWTLRLLANQIARKGVHVLRMDYHGIGDSAQSSDQIDSLQCWTRNIEQSIDHLKSLSNASTVLLIGHRLGGALAAEVALRRPDVNGIALWEPVLSGKEYLETLRKMHAQMLDLWVCRMETPNDDSIEEILGSRFQRSLVSEIEALEINLDKVIQPQLIADQADNVGRYSHPEPWIQCVLEDERRGSWSELTELESAWLRPEIMRRIVSKVDDMFSRLERYGALDAVSESQS